MPPRYWLAGSLKMKIGLALGGGASRGIAHIAMLEAFDELGLKPAIIAGCSIGALIGAGYAGGMSGSDIREHALSLLSRRSAMLRYVFGARRTRPFEMVALRGLKSVHLHGHKVAEVMMPAHLPKLIEDCIIPLKIITTDYERMEEVVLSSGSLAHAVGASIAIPGLISAPRINGRLHVDGAVINPVPFDHVTEGNDLVVAIDVIGRPRKILGDNPSNLEIAVGSSLIMFRQLAELRRKRNPPGIYILPDVDEFWASDFFKAKEILAAAEPAKERLKWALAERINASI